MAHRTEEDRSDVVSRQLVVTSGDLSEVLKPTEGILDAVALPVGFLSKLKGCLRFDLLGMTALVPRSFNHCLSGALS